MDGDGRPDLVQDPLTGELIEASSFPRCLQQAFDRQQAAHERHQRRVAAREARRRVVDVARSRELSHDPVDEGEVVYDEERDEVVRRRRRGRRTRRNPNSEPSSSRVTERSARNLEAGTTIHVRQSVLYSNRPRALGSRRGRELSPNRLLVEGCAREVSSSEGPIITDLSEFNVLALDDMPPKIQSPYWSNLPYDTGSSDSESEIVKDNPNEESDFDLEKELQEWRLYSETHTSDTISEGMDKILAVERATLAAEFDKMSAAERAEMTARSSYFSKWLPSIWCLPSPAASEAQSLQPIEQASRNEPSQQHLLRRQPKHEVSDQEIIQNGKDWMNKEVMLAFDTYKQRSANLKGLDCQFEELCHQCFNVEHYNKIFHHYNFTVKITNPSSSDSRVTLFFAEVQEIFGRQHYFCCPLEPSENGPCYACSNQGMDDLKHPATGGYDRGSTDTVFPFMYMDDSESC